MVIDYIECSREGKYDKNWKAAMGLGSTDVIGAFTKKNLVKWEVRSQVEWIEEEMGVKK